MVVYLMGFNVGRRTMGSGVLHGNMLISPLERQVHSNSEDLQKKRSARKVPSSGPFMRNLTLRLKSNEAFSSTKNVRLVRLDRRDANKKNDRNGNDRGLPEGCRGRSRYLALLTFAPRDATYSSSTPDPRPAWRIEHGTGGSMVSGSVSQSH